LIGGLADEKGRWLESVEHLDKILSNILGDVLISGGCVAYLGSFTVSRLLYNALALCDRELSYLFTGGGIS